MNQQLQDAIIAASEEIRLKFGWSFDEGGTDDTALPDGVFVSAMMKHIEPLFASVADEATEKLIQRTLDATLKRLFTMPAMTVFEPTQKP